MIVFSYRLINTCCKCVLCVRLATAGAAVAATVVAFLFSFSLRRNFVQSDSQSHANMFIATRPIRIGA